MRYKNTQTGAIIDSPFKIHGENWEEVKAKATTEDDSSKNADQKTDENQNEEYVEEEIDLESMTNKELEKFAEEQGIKLTTEDKKNKDTRIAAIVKAIG